MVAQQQDQPVEGRFDGIEHRFPVRVYFEDTDLSGVVYHANYLRYMERARSDMLRLAGIDQRAAQEAREGAYAVSALAIRYRAPAKLDDALVVNNHFDSDGVLSVFACTHPEEALRHAPLMVAGADWHAVDAYGRTAMARAAATGQQS